MSRESINITVNRPCLHRAGDRPSADDNLQGLWTCQLPKMSKKGFGDSSRPFSSWDFQSIVRGMVCVRPWLKKLEPLICGSMTPFLHWLAGANWSNMETCLWMASRSSCHTPSHGCVAAKLSARRERSFYGQGMRVPRSNVFQQEKRGRFTSRTGTESIEDSSYGQVLSVSPIEVKASCGTENAILTSGYAGLKLSLRHCIHESEQAAYHTCRCFVGNSIASVLVLVTAIQNDIWCCLQADVERSCCVWDAQLFRTAGQNQSCNVHQHVGCN